MGPRQRTRHEIIEFLGRAADEAQRAEAYHAAAADPVVLKGRPAHEAARDAAAMQLVELAGCAAGFPRGLGEPGTTLARLGDTLRPVFKVRTAHTHPETGAPAPPLNPGWLANMIGQLKIAIGNVDPDTLQILPPREVRALKDIAVGLVQIEKDGLPDAAALRPRDLHYAGYYHEIQFGRLAKATGRYDNRGKSDDARHVDINRSIFDADDMAHMFHAMRGGPDKSILPVSVVAPEHRDRVPGRLLSELLSELRFEYQTPAERRVEVQTVAIARTREQHRDAVQGLAEAYVDITGDPKAAALIKDYVQRKEPHLDRETITAMGAALRIAAVRDSGYLALPEAVRNNCIDLCLALDEQGDGRLIRLLDAVEAAQRTGDIDLDRQEREPDDDLERER